MRFNINAPFWRFMDTLLRFVGLNLVYLITLIPNVTIGPATQEKGIILLTKAHLLFMAYHARLAFQNTSVACGLFAQPGGVGT